jgi:hypothetical protein
MSHSMCSDSQHMHVFRACLAACRHLYCWPGIGWRDRVVLHLYSRVRARQCKATTQASSQVTQCRPIATTHNSNSTSRASTINPHHKQAWMNDYKVLAAAQAGPCRVTATTQEHPLAQPRPAPLAVPLAPPFVSRRARICAP